MTAGDERRLGVYPRPITDGHAPNPGSVGLFSRPAQASRPVRLREHGGARCLPTPVTARNAKNDRILTRMGGSGN